MISSEINDFINKIIDKTQNNELDWHYAEKILLNNSIQPRAISKLAEYCINKKNGTSLSSLDSFYLCNNNKYLFLLCICHHLPQNEVYNTWELFAIPDPNESFLSIPDYHPANERDRLKKLSELIVKNKRAEQEQKEKHLLDFFNSFF